MLREFHPTIPELRLLDSSCKQLIFAVKLEIVTWKSMGAESFVGDCLKWLLEELQLHFPALGGLTSLAV